MHTLRLGRVRFGAFELDPVSGELRSTEAPDPNSKVILGEQVFQVLRILLEHEGAIVTREEIKNRLWADDTIVDFDRSINATIRALRRALGDSADSPRYVETLARRGYRLMLPIEYLEPAPGTVLEKDRELCEHSATPINESVPGPDRQTNPGPVCATRAVAVPHSRVGSTDPAGTALYAPAAGGAIHFRGGGGDL